MSPNAYVCFGDDGLLHGYPGEEEVEFPVFTWTYAEFGEDVTPSMYRFMAAYVRDNISKEDLYEIQGGDYCPGDLNEEAVDAYWDLPILRKIDLHDTTLQNLIYEKREAEAKYEAAISMPVIEKSPIAKEYQEFVQGLVDKYEKTIERLQNEIYEEEHWRGGHEAGAEDF
jgi:hypothetical protein